MFLRSSDYGQVGIARRQHKGESWLLRHRVTQVSLVLAKPNIRLQPSAAGAIMSRRG
jgi:hypothetical protein